MGTSRQTEAEQPTTEQPSQHDSTLAKALAPEEVQRGDYIALLNEVAEVPSYFWCRDTALLAPDDLVRLRFIPTGSGEPLKVKSVCLPFVLVKHPCGQERPLDLRKYRVARLSKRYAVRAWKAQKKATSSSADTLLR
jgi:hypothetical protein